LKEKEKGRRKRNKKIKENKSISSSIKNIHQDFFYQVFTVFFFFHSVIVFLFCGKIPPIR
jgi:hypothetical protein